MKQSLWNGPFRFLFASNVLKVTGDSFALLVMSWWVAELGGDPLSVALLYLCSFVPGMLLSSFVSPLLSKGYLSSWMFRSDFTRALIILVIPIASIYDYLPLWLFLAIAFLQSSVGSVYQPAAMQLLPRLVEKDHLQKANAILQSSNQSVMLIGLLTAGIVTALLSPALTLTITCVLFVLSAFTVSLVQSSEKHYIQEHQEEIQKALEAQKGMSYTKRVKEGFAIVRQHKLMFALAVFCIFLNLGTTPWNSLSTIFVYENLGDDPVILSLVRGSIVTGALSMGLLLAKIKLHRPGLLFISAGIVSGVCLSIISLTDWLWLVMVCGFVMGACVSAVNVPQAVIIQTTVPPHQQAQVFSVILTISYIFLPPAILLSGPLGNQFGSIPVISVGGLIVLFSALLVGLFSPLRHMTPETEKKAESSVA